METEIPAPSGGQAVVACNNEFENQSPVTKPAKQTHNLQGYINQTIALTT